MGSPHASTIAQTVDGYIGPGTGRQVHGVSLLLATLSNAVQYHIVPGFNGRLVDVRFIASAPATTAAKSATVTPSIGGVNVTGGVLALTTAGCNTTDKETVGTPITGNNTFTAAQSVVFTASAVTAFTEGSGEIQVALLNDDTRKGVGLGNMGLAPV